MPKIDSKNGFDLYEFKGEASIGFFSNGRTGKTIKGKKSWAVYDIMGFQVGPDFKSLSEAKKYFRGLK